MTQKAIPETEFPNNTAKAQAGASSGLAVGAREITSEVKHIASDVADDAKKAAESKLGAGKDFAAEHLGSIADALRKTGKELRSSDSPATDYVEKAASSVENISNYFQTRTLSQLIGDVETYARREPAVFLGGAFFAGLLGGRFLKSATPASRRENPSSATSRLQPPTRSDQRALPQRTGADTSTTSNTSTRIGSNGPGVR